MEPDERPHVDAGLLGAVLERLPARLRRRLDADAAIAEGWAWAVDESGALTVTSEDAAVRLKPDVDAVLRELGDAACSCLLAPNCLHLAAVLIRLKPAAIEAPRVVAEGEASSETEASVSTPSAAVASSGEMRQAAAELIAAMSRLLDAGATGAGLVATGDILRAVHSCQVLGLHRAGGAGLRVAEGLARLRDDDPEFRLRDLRNDIAEALRAARQVHVGRGDRAAVGSARRAYDMVGGLRLYGLFTEPVVARSGYAGCATWLVDGTGRLWVLSDVLPAPAERAIETYASAAGLGDVSLSHRQLGREGVLLGEARASVQGRLGRGQKVRAVSARGARWAESPLAELFQMPLAEQLMRVWATANEPADERREGWSLVFAPAVIAGATGGQLVLNVGDRQLIAVAPAEHQVLAYHENLGVLAAAPGARVLVVGRPVMDRPGVMEVLALGDTPDGDLELPSSWGGRANLGLDRLARAHLHPRESPSRRERSHRTPDVVEPLGRRLDRMVLGGRLTLGVAARRGVDQDIAVMRRRHLATGASLLAELATVASDRTPGTALADRWLAATLYEQTVSQRLGAARWLAG